MHRLGAGAMSFIGGVRTSLDVDICNVLFLEDIEECLQGKKNILPLPPPTTVLNLG